MTHLLTGLTVLALIACAWLLPVLLWDVLTMPAEPLDDYPTELGPLLDHNTRPEFSEGDYEEAPRWTW